MIAVKDAGEAVLCGANISGPCAWLESYDNTIGLDIEVHSAKGKCLQCMSCLLVSVPLCPASCALGQTEWTGSCYGLAAMA